jgi:hypothetical protein
MFKNWSRLLRFATWNYLIIHGLLWWKLSINIPLALFLITLTYAVALLPARKFFPWLRVVIFLVIFVIISLMLLGVDLILFPYRPIHLIRWHLTVLPLAPFLLYFLVSTIVFERYPLLQRWEIFLKTALMLPLFWGMGDYRIVFYKHAWQVVYGVMLYLVAENMGLYLLAQRAKESSTSLRKKAPVVPVLLSLLVAGHVFFAVIMIFHDTKTLSPEGLLQATGLHFDFNDELVLEPTIGLSPRLLFLVKFEQRIEEPKLIKRLTMSGYNEKQGFHWDARVDESLYGLAHGEIRKLTLLSERSPLIQEYYLLKIPAKAQISAYDAQSVVELTKDYNSPFTSVQRVISQEFNDLYPLVATTTSGQFFSENIQNIFSNYSPNAEILQLALSITEGLTTPYEKAVALEKYLQTNFFYSLSPGIPPRGTDSLTHFLFNTRKGYCSYFAVSMTLMARMLGLSARIAGGFKIDDSQYVLGFYAVQANQAHTWVEIYFDDVGWLPFDPTSSMLAIDELLLEVDPPNDLDIYNLIMAIKGEDFSEIIPEDTSIIHVIQQRLSHLSLHMRLIIGAVSFLVLIFFMYTGLRFWQFHHWATIRSKNQSFSVRADIEFLQTKWQLMWPFEPTPTNSWQMAIYAHESFYRLYQEMLFMPHFTAKQTQYLCQPTLV